MRLYQRDGATMDIMVLMAGDSDYRAKTTYTPAGSNKTYEMKELIIKGKTRDEVLVKVGVWAGANHWHGIPRPQ